jgi:LDH2 family malate/lactate/ureidoglycolate dehydrogenase
MQLTKMLGERIETGASQGVAVIFSGAHLMSHCGKIETLAEHLQRSEAVGIVYESVTRPLSHKLRNNPDQMYNCRSKK